MPRPLLNPNDCNLNLPTSLTDHTLRNFTSIQDVFNPVIYPLHKPDFSAITYAEYKALLNIAYSHHNYTHEANTTLWVSYHIEQDDDYLREDQHRAIRAIISELIPPDKRWILSFFQPTHIDRNKWMTFRAVIPRNGWDWTSTPGQVIDDQLTGWNFRVEKKYDGNAFAEAFKAHINPFIAKWELYFTRNSRCLYRKGNSAWSNYRFFFNFFDHINGATGTWYQRGIRDNGGGRANLTLQSVIHILQGSPNIAIEWVGNSQCPQFCLKVRAGDHNRTPFHTLLNHSTDVLGQLEPGDWPEKLPDEGQPVLYGVEIESSTGLPIRDIITAQKKLFFVCKRDGSISGKFSNNPDSQCEMVTFPMSFRSLRKQWAYWFANVDLTKFDTSRKTTNGMHVHIGREHFSGEPHLRRLCWFLNNPANHAFLLAVSERNRESMTQWSPHFRIDPTLSKEKAIARTLDLATSVRGATNLGKRNTVEVRIFRAIVSYATVLKNLEFVDSVFHFTSGCSLLEVTLENYSKWLRNTPKNKYTALKRFLELIEATDYIDVARVREAIFNETDPNKIISILKKKNIDVSNKTATILNTEFKKRIFSYANDTLKIIDDPTTGRMNRYDEEFLRRAVR